MNVPHDLPPLDLLDEVKEFLTRRKGIRQNLLKFRAELMDQLRRVDEVLGQLPEEPAEDEAPRDFESMKELPDAGDD
jgi:hypothetical protein